MLDKDVSVTIILTKTRVGRRRPLAPNCRTGRCRRRFRLLLESSSWSATRPSDRTALWVRASGFGLVISGGVLEEENLSAHVQAYVMQLRGASIALVLYRTGSLAYRLLEEQQQQQHDGRSSEIDAAALLLATGDWQRATGDGRRPASPTQSARRRSCERYARLVGVKQHGGGRWQTERTRCRVHALRPGKPRSGDVCFKKQRSAAPAARASLVDRSVDARRPSAERGGRAMQTSSSRRLHTTVATRCC